MTTTGRLVVCHDYAHWDCVKTVKNDFNKVFGKPDELFYEKPSDCGLAIKYERGGNRRNKSNK